MWHKVRTWTAARPAALLVGTVLFLWAAYWPARFVFHSIGDIYLYQSYATLALKRPIELPREYPPLTAVLFVLPQLLLPSSYLVVFTLLAACVTWITLLVVDRLCHGGWWLLLYCVLGAFGTLFFRYDIFVVLVTILAFTAGVRRRWVLAQLLLAIGVALKLYPAILMPLVVLWQWRDERRLPLVSAITGTVSLLFVAGSTWLAAPTQSLEMLRYHGARPLEFESIGASLAWLLGPVVITWSFGSFNALSPLGPAIITGLTVLNVALLLALYLWFALGRLSAGSAWALALLVTIATSKVFSTQYILWALPFVVIAGESAAAAAVRPSYYRWLWVLISLCTGLIYPVGYMFAERLLSGGHAPTWLMSVVTLRNALWLAACILALRYWARHAGGVRVPRLEAESA